MPALELIMDIEIINDNFLSILHWKARESERLRIPHDLRTTDEDSSQRMLALPTSVTTRLNSNEFAQCSLFHRLNVLEPGTHVPIHRHMKTSETAICIEGRLDWIFYQELPTVNAGGPVHDGEHVIDETCFKETARFRICPREQKYGIQVPPMTWHSVEVHEPSTIFEAKDGRYEK